MNNDVIELAKEIKHRSELVLKAEHENNGEFHKYWNALDRMMSPQNLIKLCDAVDKLAEYESMEPVAYKIFDEKFNEILGFRSSKEGAEQSFLYYKDVCCCKVIPLYRHPSKESLKFTAEIELTDFTKNREGKAVAFGKIFNDSRKRFEDGVEIITSLVTNAETYKIDGYIKTQNSIYKIRE
ncbi:hypothetical protein ID852_18595 [Xenorhabdus sp. 42]|uniref:hypothetical protein n=1 Tax=Xenorhabdus szentirmaii TaxID=290112 RepID=UPI0019A7BA55|nr:hypothetical protein [Xenorhabdus sp. 42]MBD2822650.1 hypothetical protein [Xenorhabdus sp. 42]